MQEVQVPTDTVESTPEATPKVTPEVTTEPTPTEGEAVATDETTDATAEGTTEALSAEPEQFDPSQFEAESSPHRESFQKFREEEQARGWSQAHESFTGHFEAMEKRDTDLKRTYQGAIKSWDTLRGRLTAALDKGQIDSDAVAVVFQDPQWAAATEEMAKALQGVTREEGIKEGRGIGANSAMEGVVTIGAKVLGRQSLAQEFIPKIQSAQTKEAATAMIEGFINKVKDVGYQQGLADKKSGTTEATRVAKRKDQKPAQNVGSASGGKSDDELLLDPLTPRTKRVEILARRGAA